MRLVLPLLALIACVAPAFAEDPPEIVDIRGHWDACTAMLDTAPNDWTGWRRNFDGGYSDHFEFHDGGDRGVSVLVQTWLIDAFATQTDTACYRPDGTLAFIFSEMVSPNVAQNSEGAIIVRQGRIYFAPDGAVIRALSKILYEDQEVAQYDDENWMLFRGCELTRPHLTTADLRLHMDHELGTIDGDRPAFTPSEPLGWCSPDQPG